MTPFHALHAADAPGGLLILPNAWDAASAALAVAAGARAVATTSAGLVWALGWPDGARPDEGEVLGALARIVRAAGPVPVSADCEDGYAEAPAAVADFIRRVVAAGAAGINIEDGSGPPERLADKIAAIRAAVGPDLFINARCDLWLKGIGPVEGRLEAAAARATLYRAAGADGLFMPGVTDPETIRILAGWGLPLNLLARRGLAPARELEALGVRRLSAGSGLAEAAWQVTDRLTRGFLADGRSDPLIEAAMDYGALNALMKGRAGQP